MKDLFKDLGENCKVIYDNNNFAYFKADDIERFFFDIYESVGKGDCVENGFKFIEDYLCKLGESEDLTEFDAREVRKLEHQTANFRHSFNHVKAVIK